MLRRFFLSLVPTLLFLAAASVAEAGFGITPPYVNNQTLTRGSEFTQVITIVRNNPEEELIAEVTLDGADISEWISIDRGYSFIIPEGEEQTQMTVTVNVPEDAEYAEYESKIRIRTYPSQRAEDAAVTIAIGARIDVDLRVVDKYEDFNVRNIELSETEEGNTVWLLDYPGKIDFTMFIENTGNMPTAPTKVEFEIYDSDGEELLETVRNTNKIEPVPAFKTTKTVAHLPTQLEAGSYQVRFGVYLKEEAKRRGEMTLNILPPGTLSDYEGYGFSGLPMEDKLLVVAPPSFVTVFGITGAAWYARTGSSKPQRPLRNATNMQAQAAARDPRRRSSSNQVARRRKAGSGARSSNSSSSRSTRRAASSTRSASATRVSAAKRSSNTRVTKTSRSRSAPSRPKARTDRASGVVDLSRRRKR